MQTLIRLALAASLLLIASVAHADVVHLKDGRKLTGESRWTGKGLELKTKFGTIVFKKSDVLRVEKKETPEQEYARRLKALDPANVEAALELGLFCKSHKVLKKHAPALLLDVDKRAASKLTTLEPSAKPAISLRKVRVQAADALRSLDYHLVKGTWQSPDVYYPANGYVKVGKRWITKAEAARRGASKARRAAKRDAKVAARAAKRSAKSLAAAKESLDAALRANSKSKARTKHYASELKRVEANTKTLETERIVIESDLRRLKSEQSLAQAAYVAWHDKPCKCRGGRCSCGWTKRDKALYLIVATADSNYRATYNKLQRLRKRLVASQRAELTATKLLAKARRTESKAKANLSIARLDFEDAERRAAGAKGSADEKKDDLKDADRKVRELGGK